MALLKWGSAAQKARMAAAARERRDDRRVRADRARRRQRHSSRWPRDSRRRTGGTSHPNGRKKWISCAQFADVFLVFGKLDSGSVAVPGAAGHAGVQQSNRSTT